MVSFSSLDARIVEFPVLIRDLPVWAFPLLTRSSSVVGAVLPGPDCWLGSFSSMEALVFPFTCGAPF